MPQQRYYLAIDIGASSGRHVLGSVNGNGVIELEEVHRFDNVQVRRRGHDCWDIDMIWENILVGLEKCRKAGKIPETIGIDTWGVDFVLVDARGRLVGDAVAYRDARTNDVAADVDAGIGLERLYRVTGIQRQAFNTVYQLFADLKAGRLDKASDFLLMPEYLLWKLCGVKSHEYTNATTGGMVSAETGAFDIEIIKALGLPKRLFCTLQKPGTVIGEYEGIKCVLCATHDTASAVEGIPMEGSSPYISSGTWSLLGVKTPKPITDESSRAANYSNEGGVGCNRYQKNIMGMWLINRLRDELCPDKTFSDIVAEAQQSRFDATVDADSPDFLAPESMKAAFDAALAEKPQSCGDYFRCAYRSLALSYKKALGELEVNTGKQYDELYIVGGGAKNTFLNTLTAELTGKRVIALPIEATAIGNLKIQMEADK